MGLFNLKKNMLIQGQGTIDNGRIGKVPKLALNVSKIDEKRDFSSKMTSIDSKYDSFIHFTIKFNSKDYSISFFQEY